MDEGKISIRYAKALYELALEKGLQQEIYACMVQLSRAFIEVPGLDKSLSNPMHGRTAKLELLQTASGSGKESLLSEFFSFLLKKEREAYAVFIAASFQKIYREKQRIVTGLIESATPLAEGTLDRIRQLVDQRFQANIELETTVNPDILGGFILEVDNYRMDSSIRTELERIKTELTQV